MLESIDTPALLLDLEKLRRNCERMRERVHGKGAVLRPHVKTAKSLEVAQCALGRPPGQSPFRRVREAEYFFDHGFRGHPVRGRDGAFENPAARGAREAWRAHLGDRRQRRGRSRPGRGEPEGERSHPDAGGDRQR